jgi:sigma-E factor negative regulatory protein RseA
MAMDTFDEAAARQALSALADGELAGDAGGAAFKAWRSDSGARRDWHAWHLIGDVLRSEDLASDPRADLRFCVALRARLASEAIVLAPAAVADTAAGPGSAPREARARSGRWMFASAAAAGFVLVAGTFAVVRTVDAPIAAPTALADGNSATSVARARESASVAALPAPLAEASAPPVAVLADSRMIRDAQLDRYLVAHKQFAGTSALGVPSVFLRSATVDSASR